MQKDERKPRIVIGDLDVFTASDAKNRFGELLHRVCYQKTPVLIEKSGRPVAVVLDYNLYVALRKQSGNQQEPEKP